MKIITLYQWYSLHYQEPDSAATAEYHHVTSCRELPHVGCREAGAESSFMDSAYKSNYVVFRNVVTDFGADNTGSTDASVAIQNAINSKSFHENFFGRQ